MIKSTVQFSRKSRMARIITSDFAAVREREKHVLVILSMVVISLMRHYESGRLCFGVRDRSRIIRDI